MPRASWILASGGLAVGAGLVLACGGGSEDRPPARSALIVTLDTTRADVLGCYREPAQAGRCVDASPRLDALARESVLYRTARATAPMTLPSHASMMTGLYPPRHAARDNLHVLPRSARTLAEAARAAGFETAAFVAAAVLDRASGLAQGFETYDSTRRAADDSSLRIAERPAPAIVERFEHWLATRSSERPFVAWVHLFDPHAPYAAPPAFAARERDPYCAEVAAADAAVGRLLDRLAAAGLLAETLVVVVGDHGESLGQHGEATHAALCYEATLRVPFLVRHPDGHRAGERSDEIVSVTDLHPTVLAALGLEVPPDLDGVDLFSGRAPSTRGVYFESYCGYLYYGLAPLSGWADRGGKYLHGPEPEFYPGGMDDAGVRLADPGATAPYRAAIDAVCARPALRREEVAQADQAASLASLGYATASLADAALPHPLAPVERPDVRARMDEISRTIAASDLGDDGWRDRAIAELRAIVDENPANLQARKHLADFLILEERWEDAARELELYLQRSETPIELNNLAGCLQQLGRNEDAIRHYERALALSADRSILRNYTTFLVRIGRREQAERVLERARAASRE